MRQCGRARLRLGQSPNAPHVAYHLGSRTINGHRLIVASLLTLTTFHSYLSEARANTMALVLGSPQAPSGPRDALDEAIRDFRSILSNDDLATLQDVKEVPPEQAVMQFTARLDATRRSKKGRSIASRMYTVLQTVRDFSTIVDTFISSRLEIAALVWGSVKITMLVSSEVYPNISGQCLTLSRSRSILRRTLNHSPTSS